MYRTGTVDRSARRFKSEVSEGDGGFVIEFGGVCYQDTYPMYLACNLHVFRMYLDVIRSYTSKYTKIHQDTSRYICIYLFGYHGNVSYLGIWA